MPKPAIPARSSSVPVALRDGTTYNLAGLLSPGDSNTKQAKGSALGYLTANLSLAAARSSGHEVCPSRTPGCTAGCLLHAGRARVFPAVNRARIARTRLYFRDRPAFLALLHRDLKYWSALAEYEGLTLAVRLNTFSDVPWERRHPELFADHPNVIYYDYSKVISRLRRPLPPNYHLTFSRSETNEADCRQALRLGVNVAVVFGTAAFPAEYLGVPVVSGEEHDLRFLDPRPRVVALVAKGDARADRTGFVVRGPSRDSVNSS
jgi:hypothetical protein